MAYDRDNGSSNTAIFGIVALVIVGLLVFFLFFRDGGGAGERGDSDVTLNVNPENAPSEGGDAEPLLDGDGLGEPQPQDQP